MRLLEPKQKDLKEGLVAHVQFPGKLRADGTYDMTWRRGRLVKRDRSSLQRAGWDVVLDNGSRLAVEVSAVRLELDDLRQPIEWRPAV